MSALAVYLQDHHAAGCAGARLARRVGDRSGRPLAGVATEIEQDLRTLEQVMRQLGVEPSSTKDVLARIAEQLVRAKQNRLFGSTNPTELIDLETLVVGITGKRALWISLREIDALPDPSRLDGLIERATAQLETVEGCRRLAAKASLG